MSFWGSPFFFLHPPLNDCGRVLQTSQSAASRKHKSSCRPFENTHTYIPTRCALWPRTRMECAEQNSFDIKRDLQQLSAAAAAAAVSPRALRLCIAKGNTLTAQYNRNWQTYKKKNNSNAHRYTYWSRYHHHIYYFENVCTNIFCFNGYNNREVANKSRGYCCCCCWRGVKSV